MGYVNVVDDLNDCLDDLLIILEIIIIVSLYGLLGCLWDNVILGCLDGFIVNDDMSDLSDFDYYVNIHDCDCDNDTDCDGMHCCNSSYMLKALIDMSNNS